MKKNTIALVVFTMLLVGSLIAGKWNGNFFLGALAGLSAWNLIMIPVGTKIMRHYDSVSTKQNREYVEQIRNLTDQIEGK